MCAASFFKRVVNNPCFLCLVVGGVMSGALYLGGVMTVNPLRMSFALRPVTESKHYLECRPRVTVLHPPTGMDSTLMKKLYLQIL